MNTHIKPAWLSIPQCAIRSGFTSPTIRKAIKLGVLPHRKIRLDGPQSRASVRVRVEDLDAWIEGDKDLR